MNQPFNEKQIICQLKIVSFKLFLLGYVGLLLGVAIFHLADMINLFLDTRIDGYQKIVEEEQKDEQLEGSELYQVIKNEASVTFS